MFGGTGFFPAAGVFGEAPAVTVVRVRIGRRIKRKFNLLDILDMSREAATPAATLSAVCLRISTTKL
jgi:hypothetical protein